MDKTYSETRGEAPFDWGLKLRALAGGEMIESGEQSELVYRAGNWVSCACGNQCAIIPRHDENFSEGAPIDAELRCLGVAFMGDIENEDWISAQETLSQIEARSTILIREELAKLNTAPACTQS